MNTIPTNGLISQREGLWLPFIVGVHGGFITKDQKAQLIAQGSSLEMLQAFEQLRGRLLGGMRQADLKNEIAYIRKLVQEDFVQARNTFSLLLTGLGGEEQDPQRQPERNVMEEIVEIGIKILKHEEFPRGDFRLLFGKILDTLTHFKMLRIEQHTLACLAAQNELKDAKTRSSEIKLPFFINATYYYAKAFSIDDQNLEPLKEISKIFMEIIKEIMAPRFEGELSKAIGKGDWEYFQRSIDRISLLEKFQNSQDDATIRNLYHRASARILEFERQGKKIPQKIRDVARKIALSSASFYGSLDTDLPLREYRERLENFRKFLRQEIGNLQGKSVRDLQKETYKKFLHFFNTLLLDAVSIVGPPPCDYDLRAYGSLAREELCPYSDLEWMILIEEDTVENRLYFKTLAQLVSLEIVSIGETAPSDFPIFSATGVKHPSGFHVDTGGDPAQLDHLIGTPDSLAHLQAFIPGPDGFGSPTDLKFSLRNTVSLDKKSSRLFEKYDKAIHLILDENRLREKRAVSFLKYRLAAYEELFSKDWRKEPIIHLKNQFLELLNHPLSDLALYFGCKKLNTLDVIDELPCFTLESRLLLKEIVSFLYVLRIKLHFHYEEQKELATWSSEEIEDCFVLEQKDKDLLETAYFLVLSPFYSYLKDLFSEPGFVILDGSSSRESFLIGEISLLDLAFKKACKNPNSKDSSDAIRLLTRVLNRLASQRSDILPRLPGSFAEISRRATFFDQQLSEKPLEPLKRAYWDGLQTLGPSSGKDLVKAIHANLERVPDFSGNRPVLSRKRSTFSENLLKITSNEKIQGSQRSVQIYSPFFEKRHLLPQVVDAILDVNGHIKKQMKNTNSRVSSYKEADIGFHFKEKPTDYQKESPFHPGKERAASELMFRLFGRGTSISELFEFEVEIPNKEPQKYLVLISETVPGVSPDLIGPPEIDPIQLSELFLSLPLLLPGDMRPANLIKTPEDELISVDNDVCWVEPYTQEGCNLYTILPFLYPDHVLHPEAITAFLDLKPKSLLTAWLHELIRYNDRVLATFETYEGIAKDKHLFSSILRSSIYYTSGCYFEKGTGSRLLLQFHRLQEFLQKNKNREIPATEVLQTIISTNESKTLFVGPEIYKKYQTIQSKKDVKISDKVKQVAGRDPNSSASMTASSALFYRELPTNKSELSQFDPKLALKEIEDLSVLEINEEIGLSLKIGELSSLHLKSPGVLANIEPNTQRYLFQVLSLHEFEHLDLSYSVLEDSELEMLLKKSGEHLKKLDLRNCSNLTNKSIQSIHKYCPALEELYLSRCDQIESFTAGLLENPVKLLNLKVLHLAECPKLRSLKIHAPTLTSLKITDTPLLKVSEELVGLFDTIAKNLQVLGKSAAALEYSERAVEMRKELLSGQFFKTSSEDLINSLCNVANALEKSGSHEKALTYRKQVLEMRQQLLKAPHPDLAGSLDDIASSLTHLRRHNEAFKQSMHALEMREKLFKAPHLDLARSLDCVGGRLVHLRVIEALKYFERALEMKKQLFHPSHQDLANSLYFIGFSLYRLGRYSESLDRCKQAVEMQKRLFLFSREILVDSLYFVGLNLYQLGKYGDSLEYFKQASEIWREHFSEDLKILAPCLSNIGIASGVIGKRAEALMYATKVLEMSEQLSNEPELMICIFLNSARTFSKLGDHKKVFDYATKALEVQRLFDAPDSVRASILRCLGIGLNGLGRHDEALTYFKQALEMRKTLFGEKHFAITQSLDDIGETLGNLGKHEEAYEYHLKAHAMGHALYPKNYAYLARSLHLLGKESFSLNKDQQAFSYFKRALELKKGIFKDPHPDKVDCLKDMAKTLRRLGREDEALIFDQQSLEMAQSLKASEALHQSELKHPKPNEEEKTQDHKDLGESSSSALRKETYLGKGKEEDTENP